MLKTIKLCNFFVVVLHLHYSSIERGTGLYVFVLCTVRLCNLLLWKLYVSSCVQIENHLKHTKKEHIATVNRNEKQLWEYFQFKYVVQKLRRRIFSRIDELFYFLAKKKRW